VIAKSVISRMTLARQTLHYHLFSRLQEQLGLKLEYNKNPLDVIVIDHIEKLSAN
jgi:uncharacterized protein (TIGR03435 family)